MKRLLNNWRRWAVAAFLARAFLSPSPLSAESVTPGKTGAGLAEFVRRFDSDRGDVERFYNLPWSEARFDRLAQVYKDWQTKLEAVDFEALDQAGRIDYLLLRNKLAEERAHLALDRQRLAEMDQLVPFRKPVQSLEQARWLTAPVNAASAAEIVAAIPDQIKKLRDRLEKEGPAEKSKEEKPAADDKKTSSGAQTNKEPKIKISATLARRTASAVGAIRDALGEWFAFYDGSVPEFSWWVKKPRDEADKALEEYSKFLREEIAGLKGKDEDPLVGDPIGAEALANDLAAESIPYATDELVTLAEREFAWCEAQMRKAAGEMGMGENWKAALAKVKLDYSPPGKQDELVAALSREAIRFVKDRDLVTIPPLCEETWRLTMSSPETQKSLPYAAYGGQNMMVAYAKEEMKNDDKLMSMRGNNRHFTRIVVAHELIPGHHLQLFMGERNQTHRSIFRTPFLVEGWALSWELRLWELAYPQTPEDRVGMLFWRMHRCARIIVSLKFHLGKMTPAEMVDFLVDRVGHERLGATSEVRRYIGGGYSPLYQCSYLLGGLQLRALRREAVDSGKMTEKQFNDAVLAQNAIPIEMIRAAILNLQLARDTKTSWRFADGEPELIAK
jgi:uncharacterized protein (DUF885 family)